MAFIHCEGFDQMTVSPTNITELALEYLSPGGSTFWDLPYTGSTYARHGVGKGIKIYDQLGLIVSPRSSFVEGFALYVDASAPQPGTVASLWDDAGARAQLVLTINGDNSVSVYLGGLLHTSPSGSPLATSDVNKIRQRTWMFIEWKGVIDPTAGSVTVRVNGETVVDVSGINTRSTANSTYTTAYLANPGVACWTDDWYLLDQDGLSLNDFLGDIVVEDQLALAGNGHYTEFTPSTGSDRGAMVDDPTFDGDDTYNWSLTPDVRDTFVFPAITRLDSVDAVRSE